MMEKVLLPFFDVAVWIKEERAMAKALVERIDCMIFSR